MAPPTIDLDPFKEVIRIRYLDENDSLPNLCSWLEENHSVRIKPRALEKRLRAWGIRKLNHTHDTPQLRLRMAVLFTEIGLDDTSIKEVLEKEGYQVSTTGLIKIRKEMGLVRRTSKEVQQQHEGKLEEIVQRELDRGNINMYGRRMAYHYFRSQGILASRSVHSIFSRTINDFSGTLYSAQ